jgi:hypothetical protein
MDPNPASVASTSYVAGTVSLGHLQDMHDKPLEVKSFPNWDSSPSSGQRILKAAVAPNRGTRIGWQAISSSHDARWVPLQLDFVARFAKIKILGQVRAEKLRDCSESFMLLVLSNARRYLVDYMEENRGPNPQNSDTMLPTSETCWR